MISRKLILLMMVGIILISGFNLISSATNITDSSIQTTGNIITTNYFIGDGSQLTGIVESDPHWVTNKSSYVPWSQLWSQVYNETEVVAINTSMKNYVDSNPGTYITLANLAPYPTWTTIWSQIYNKTEVNDLLSSKITWAMATNGTLALTSAFTNYYTKTESDLINASNNNYLVYANTTMKNYVDTRPSGGTDWTTIWSQIYNETEIVAINTSMKNYVDSLPSSGIDWETLWAQVYNETEVNAINASVNNYIATLPTGTDWTTIWSQIYNKTESDLINSSMKNYADSTFQPIGSYLTASDLNPYSTLSYLTSAHYNKTEIALINSSMKNYVDSLPPSVDWATIWSQIYNETEINAMNASNNNYIIYTNTTLANYVNTENTRFNTTIADYVNSNFVVNSGGDNLSGQYDFNGGWTSDGLSIIEGDLYAQTGYFYNITSLEVNTLNINGSIIPQASFDNQFDLGSGSLRWKDLYLGGTFYGSWNGSVNYPTYAALWSQVYNESEVNEINTSMKNYVDSNPGSYIDASSLAPYTTLSYLGSAHYNKTEVNAINTSNNNYIVYTNTTLANYVDTENTRVNATIANYVDTRGYLTSGNLAPYSTLSYLTSAHYNKTEANNLLAPKVDWTTLWTQVYNETEIGLINTSMKNYVDSNPGSYITSGSLTPYSTLAYLTSTHYNKTEVGAINTSMKNYVAYANTTLANYVNTENTRVNTTLANYVNTQDTLYNNTLKSYVDSQDTSVNTTMKNYVDTRGYGQLSGAGTYGYVPMWNGTHEMNNSNIYQKGSNIGIGTTNPESMLHIESATDSRMILKTTGSGATNIWMDANRTVGAGADLSLLRTFWNGTEVGRIFVESSTAAAAKDDGEMSFWTKKTGEAIGERMRIDDEGNVGIGTTTPAQNFHLNETGSNDNAMQFSYLGNNSYIFQDVSDDSSMALYTNSEMWFATNNDEKMRIDSSGNVGIGTVSPGAKLDVATEDATDSSYFTRYTTDTSGDKIRFRKARGTLASPTIVSSGDRSMNLIGQGYDGDSFSNLAEIIMEVDGTPGDGDMPGKITFATSADGSASATARMTIKNDGNVGIGTISPGTILEIGDGTAQDTFTINSLQGSNDTLMSTIIFENNADTIAMINAFRGSTATAGELRFGTQKTAGIEYNMVLDEDGNVGIGTTTPSSPLSIQTSESTPFGIYNSTGDLKIWYSIAGDDGDLFLRDSEEAIQIGLRSDGDSFINQGNVGIGTTTPGAKLEVIGSSMHLNQEGARIRVGNEQASGDVHIGSSGMGNPSNGLQDYGFYAAHNAYRGSDGNWYHSRTATIPAVRYTGGGGVASGTSGFLWDYSANSGEDFINWTNLMTLTTSGNLGIGTTSPSYPLMVESNSYTDGVHTIAGFVSEVTGISQGGVYLGYYANGTAPTLSTIYGGAKDLVLESWNGAARAENLRIVASSGNVGIGTTAPGTILHVSDSNPRVLISDNAAASGQRLIFGTHASYWSFGIGMESANKLSIGRTAVDGDGSDDTITPMLTVTSSYVGIGMTDPSVALDVTGDIEYTGTITDVSDIRLKENIVPIESALEDLMNLEGKSFNMIGNNVTEFGFIAQDVQKVIPEVISITDPEKGYIGINYMAFTPFIVEGMKEQQTQIIELKQENQAIKNCISNSNNFEELKKCTN